MKKLVIFIIIGILIGCLIGAVINYVYSANSNQKNEDDFEKEIIMTEDDLSDYKGPVPRGYDVDNFRKTGETIGEEKINGT